MRLERLLHGRLYYGWIVVGVTFLFLITRWIWRKVAGRDETPRRPALPADDSERLKRLENGIDAMAVEIERISEGQRFTTRLLTDQRESAPGLTTGANR